MQLTTYGTCQKNDADIQNVFQNVCLQHSCAENRKVSSNEVEGFFRTVVGSHTQTFPKHGAALLTDLLELCLRLSELRL